MCRALLLCAVLSASLSGADPWCPAYPAERRVLDRARIDLERSAQTYSASAAASKKTPLRLVAQGTNLMDGYIFGKMRQDGVTPAPRTSDAKFVRRVTLDLAGRIPSVEEMQQFSAIYLMPVSANAHLNFGYPWWLSYGHLIVVIGAVSILLLGYTRKWSKWPMLLLGILVLWSSAAFLVAHFVIGVNGRASLPTQSFLRSGVGRVLDIGAGTGRSSIMVLESRPQATLVALDLFAESFERHFGRGESPQQRLLANLKAAGVEQRATIQTGDMRKLPFEPAAFDAVVSAYAIDHLNRQGINQSLAEAARVVKPGGDFLLIVIAKEPWVQFAFGPLLMHSGTRSPAWWTTRLQEAGFQVLEEGTRPATLYLLARRL